MEITYDFERVGNNADSHKLFTVVATVHHQRVGEALDDGALCFPEALDSIATGGVRDVDGSADLDVVTGRREYGLACVLYCNSWVYMAPLDIILSPLQFQSFFLLFALLV